MLNSLVVTSDEQIKYWTSVIAKILRHIQLMFG